MTKQAAGADIKSEEELSKIAEDLEKQKPTEEEAEDDSETDDPEDSERDGEDSESDSDEHEDDGEADDDEQSGQDDKEGSEDGREDSKGKSDGQDDDGSDEDSQKSSQEVKSKKLSELSPEETRKKLIDSSREAQVLYARNKQVQDAIIQANSIPAPTDDEMRKEFPNWDKLDDFSKRMARDNITNSRRLAAVTSVTQDFKDQDAWMDRVDKFIDNPETLATIPALEGLQDEFRKFASLPTRRGINFQDLTNAFLYEREQIKKSKPAKKGGMFPAGSGGVKKAKTDGKLTASDAATLRKTNYPKFVQMLKAGKINSTEL